MKINKKQLNRMVGNIFAEMKQGGPVPPPGMIGTRYDSDRPTGGEDPREMVWQPQKSGIPLPFQIRTVGTIPQAFKAVRSGELFSLGVSLEVSDKLRGLANGMGFLNDPDSGYSANIGELAALGASESINEGWQIAAGIAAGVAVITGLIIFAITKGYGVKVDADPGIYCPGCEGAIVFKPPGDTWPEDGKDTKKIQDSPPAEIEDVSVTDVEEKLVAEVIRRLTRK